MTHYKARYLMPKNPENQGTSTFYSLNIGYVHFVFINTNTFYSDLPEEERAVMLAWLKNDLKNANENRDKQPWIVALSHHPLYCSHENETYSIEDCVVNTANIRFYLEDIYMQNSVDLVLQGHIHKYERDGPIYNNKKIASDFDTDNMHINARAPVYIITGNAATTEGNRDSITDSQNGWEIKQFYEYGFGVLQCLNKTHLHWEQFSSEHEISADYLYLIKY